MSQIAGGWAQSVALKDDGMVVVWGDGINTGETNVPPGLTNVMAIAGGVNYTLALDNDGRVVGWGWNPFGQTVLPAGIINIVSLSAGWGHSLALDASGTVTGWGLNDRGQTNVPAGLGNTEAVTAGDWHSMALRQDGTVVAWGWNDYGQTNVPSAATNVVAIAAGWAHSLALKADGSVIAWGLNDHGQTGVPLTLSNAAAIAAEGWHSMALTCDGHVVVWGQTGYGEADVPDTLENVIAIASGSSHCLALEGDGRPFLTVQPFSKTVSIGSSTTLNAMVVGAQPMAYQWQCNGTNIAGATNSTLTVSTVLSTSGGNYRVFVCNALGSVKSSVATLTVIGEPLRFDTSPSAMQMTSGSLRLRLLGCSGEGAVIVYASTNLESWQSIRTNPPVAGVFEFADSVATNYVRRYYRAAEVGMPVP